MSKEKEAGAMLEKCAPRHQYTMKEIHMIEEVKEVRKEFLNMIEEEKEVRKEFLNMKEGNVMSMKELSLVQ
jgi:hypothetical protein